MTARPLKWHGGKHYLAKRLVELMPPHLHYAEPYFGGGAVLFARDTDRDWYEGAHDWDGSAAQRGCSEVVNDLNYQLTNFWTVLQHDSYFAEFIKLCTVTPLSEIEFKCAMQANKTKPVGVDALHAYRFFVRYRQSRQGLGKDFATMSRTRTRGRINEQANSWLSAVEGLQSAHQRLQGVVIFNRHALDVIRQQDGSRTHFYCDPPYIQESRVTTGEYEHEMTDVDHSDLLDCLADIDGTFQLSGYHSDMYDRFAEQQGWRCVEIKIDNKASSKTKKDIKTECVWMNY